MLCSPPSSTQPSPALVTQVITSTSDASGGGSGSGSGSQAQGDNVLVHTAVALEYSLLRNINHCPL
ncbi:hypothetical protein BJ165DRAFT_1508977, partial [Panaeolus papilionaceus]